MIVFDCMTTGGSDPHPTLPGFDYGMVIIDWHATIPDSAMLESAAREHAGKLVCLDIEHLPVDAWHADRQADVGVFRDGPEAVSNRAILSAVADELHALSPGMRMGFFGLMPLEHYAAIEHPDRPDPARLVAWQQQNAATRRGVVNGRFTTRGLADCVDCLFTQRYAYNADFDLWAGQSEMVLREAERYDKPFVPIIGPMLLHSPGYTTMGRQQMTRQLDWMAARGVKACGLYGRMQPGAEWFKAACEWAK